MISQCCTSMNAAHQRAVLLQMLHHTFLDYLKSCWQAATHPPAVPLQVLLCHSRHAAVSALKQAGKMPLNRLLYYVYSSQSVKPTWNTYSWLYSPACCAAAGPALGHTHMRPYCCCVG
jgi:hypothetical protein